MIVKGLESYLYFANNPIYITFDNINANTKYIEYFPMGANINPIRLYVNNRTSIQVDISQLIKLLFKKVRHNTDYTTLGAITVQNNLVNVSLIIKEVYNSGQEVYTPTLNKTFLNGGRRTYDKNQNYTVNIPLAPTKTIPKWGGYPIDYYYVDTNRNMVKHNTIPGNFSELRRIKGCDPVYVKFKNSLGGYSYWLFENSEVEESSKNIGIVEGVDSFMDLGNNLDEGIEVTSKVPKRFMPIMFDLVSSNEIYIFLGNNKWEQVKNDNNKLKQNPFNENEKVKLKFKKVHRYNPTLIW